VISRRPSHLSSNSPFFQVLCRIRHLTPESSYLKISFNLFPPLFLHAAPFKTKWILHGKAPSPPLRLWRRLSRISQGARFFQRGAFLPFENARSSSKCGPPDTAGGHHARAPILQGPRGSFPSNYTGLSLPQLFCRLLRYCHACDTLPYRGPTRATFSPPPLNIAIIQNPFCRAFSYSLFSHLPL